MKGEEHSQQNKQIERMYVGTEYHSVRLWKQDSLAIKAIMAIMAIF